MTDTSDEHSNKHASGGNDANLAADLVRQKLNAIYKKEPDAREEAEEIIDETKPLSKHQSYMKNLTESGMPLAEIQTAWHKYYEALPDNEKHEVWQEFYAQHKQKRTHAEPKEEASTKNDHDEQKAGGPVVGHVSTPEPKKAHPKFAHKNEPRTIGEIKEQLLAKANKHSQGRLSKKQHFQSILFGLGLGSVVVLLLLFSFFNERFIAPFITPSKQVSSTPIIIDSSTTAVDPTPKVIIPKINVEIPTVYDEPSVEEHAIQKALERGVVHYATTSQPGEKGNAVVFGHSSNNILNSGKYKFAFVLLNKLEVGDTFYLTKNSTRFAYRIYEKKIVKPTELGVLGATDKTATATLITCDPPGTSINRLIVIGEQISPDPNSNKASTAVAAGTQPAIIPSNAPSLWSRLTGWLRN